jgi:uncharacterized protein YndB with AHSA1/START domain
MTFYAPLDLQFERDIDIAPDAVWRAWTQPELLMQWFCPRPWQVVDCEIDLRPGGVFSTTMQSPEGQRMPAGIGCYLQLEPDHRLVWTNALGPDFRPMPMGEAAEGTPGFTFVADLCFEAWASGTRYRACVRHADVQSRDRHAAMGFEEGWGVALDQMVQLMKRAA